MKKSVLIGSLLLVGLNVCASESSVENDLLSGDVAKLMDTFFENSDTNDKEKEVQRLERFDAFEARRVLKTDSSVRTPSSAKSIDSHKLRSMLLNGSWKTREGIMVLKGKAWLSHLDG